MVMKLSIPVICVVLMICQCQPVGEPVEKMDAVDEPEIIYHICQRSFYDSDGDRHGDLVGLQQKLDYLQELGITSVLLFPLYESDYYHNYFPDNFETIRSRIRN